MSQEDFISDQNPWWLGVYKSQRASFRNRVSRICLETGNCQDTKIWFNLLICLNSNAFDFFSSSRSKSF